VRLVEKQTEICEDDPQFLPTGTTLKLAQQIPTQQVLRVITVHTENTNKITCYFFMLTHVTKLPQRLLSNQCTVLNYSAQLQFLPWTTVITKFLGPAQPSLES